MGIIMVVTIVLFLVLAIFRPDLVTRGLLAVVEVPKTILGGPSPKELPPPVFDEVTDEEYYELVKRNVSDWVADAELIAIEQFEVDEAKAHKIEASYLKQACTCEICLTPKPKSISVMHQQMVRALSILPPRFSTGGEVGIPGLTVAGQVMAFEDKVRGAFKANQLQALTIKADKITTDPQPTSDRAWPSFDDDEYHNDDDDDDIYYGNYSAFRDMTNRIPRTNHEVGVARKLQQLEESTEHDTVQFLDGYGSVVATKNSRSGTFSDEAHRILRWGGIAPSGLRAR